MPAEASSSPWSRSVEDPFSPTRKTSRYCTGRKHQIRRHLKHIFHPVIGDTTHGDGRHNRFFREHLDCDRLLLAAVGLRFIHPFSGESVLVEAGPGAEFDGIIGAVFGGGTPSPPDTMF